MKVYGRYLGIRRNCTRCRSRGRRDAARRTLNGNKAGAITRKSNQYDSDEHRIERLALAQ